MTQDITTALDVAFGKETRDSVAICGFSIHDSGESPLFDYYHTANGLSPNGTNSVGPDTVFRIGSISKLFTVYQLLLHGGHDLLNEPISRYLDDLPADNGYNTSPTVKWDEIEVGALAGQMGGILRDYNHAGLAGSNLPFQKLGLPKLSDKDTPHCDGNLSQPLCSRKDFLQGLDQQPPVFPAWETPAYSNAAFRILGYVAANVTNITMVDAFGAAIFHYGVTFSVLTAGKDNCLVSKLADVIEDTALKGVATAAREQSAQQFAGRYEGSNQPGDLLVIAVDEMPGLVIREWKSNSIDFLQVAQDYATSTGGGLLQSVRLYPTGISNRDQVIFRAAYNTTTSGISQSGLFDHGYQA
ncbi:hypothetical protein LT330_005387 [Penicillium expansum]|nr:hypothetical protein LT330_005387 [Penicillium expansum]